MSYGQALLDDYNYMNDRRVKLANSDYDRFDPDNMRLYVELYDDETDEEYEASFPAKYEVCPSCDGKGRHVKPSIDAGGLSHDDLYDDPDFAEAYFSGAYDVDCYCCKGKRVVPEADEKHFNDEEKKHWKVFQELLRDRMYHEAECAAERRMGA